MKTILLFFSLSILFSCASQKQDEQVLRNVVMFNWLPATSPEKIQELSQLFASLPSKIDVIQDFEWGTDISVEGLTKGFTHCYIVTFADEEGRNIYIPHPDHKAFGESLGSYVEDVLVLDFIPTD